MQFYDRINVPNWKMLFRWTILWIKSFVSGIVYGRCYGRSGHASSSRGSSRADDLAELIAMGESEKSAEYILDCFHVRYRIKIVKGL